MSWLKDLAETTGIMLAILASLLMGLFLLALLVLAVVWPAILVVWMLVEGLT